MQIKQLLATAVTLATACAPAAPTPPVSSTPDRMVATFQGPDGPITASYTMVDGRAMVGGDMMFTPQSAPAFRSAAYPAARWPGGTIPYEPPLADEPGYNDIMEGIGIWNAYAAQTGVAFVPRNGDETGFIYFTNHAETCHAEVGYQGRAQEVNLGSNCYHRNVILHELGHAIGLMHEHQRPDRDQYITIDSTNLTGSSATNVDIIQGAVVTGPYQYSSIMHYDAHGLDGFAADPAKPVVSMKDPSLSTSILGGRTLTAADIQGVAKLYGGRAAGAGTTTGTNTGASSCTNTCETFQLLEGSCRAFSSGSFECRDGCLEQVSACPDLSSAPCQFSCADYSIPDGQCITDTAGQAWECAGLCLGRVDSCPGELNGCEFRCEDYQFSQGQCSASADGSYWFCDRGCLQNVVDCSDLSFSR